jgi:pimeloyl-ACP methyl ester carboxylesterase
VVNLAYEIKGAGQPVLFIAGRGGAGRTWHLHQVPAFLRAGYRAVTFDNRGVGATENAQGFTTETVVADTVELIEHLRLGPTRVVGVSMGAFIAQELMLARPDLVSQAVLIATRGRHDRTREMFGQAENELAESGIELPAAYQAKVRLLENFSPKTVNNDHVAVEWLEMFTIWPIKQTSGFRCQLDISPHANRLPAYRSISTPTLVVGFTDDVVVPSYLGKEVADALPKGRYVEIPNAGHLGFLEQPDAVNAVMLRFFANASL